MVNRKCSMLKYFKEVARDWQPLLGFRVSTKVDFEGVAAEREGENNEAVRNQQGH